MLYKVTVKYLLKDGAKILSFKALWFGTSRPYRDWLKERNINYIIDEACAEYHEVAFQFENIDDAIFFKLVWG